VSVPIDVSVPVDVSVSIDIGEAMAANLVVRMPDHPDTAQLRELCVELLSQGALRGALRGAVSGIGGEPSWPAAVAPDAGVAVSGSRQRGEAGMDALVGATGGSVSKASSWCEQYLGLRTSHTNEHPVHPSHVVSEPAPRKDPDRKTNPTEATLPRSSLEGWDSSTPDPASSSSPTVTSSTLPATDLQAPVESIGS
jgi:hypothetical protein